jgi:CRAL/TRIO domain
LLTAVPTFVWIFFKLISPFIDPTTREKLKFNEDLRTYIPSEQLYDLFGGDLEFEYDHEIFWPMLLKLASERRDRMFGRWKAAGGGIGQSEWDLKMDEDTLTEVAAAEPLSKLTEEPTAEPVVEPAAKLTEEPIEEPAAEPTAAAERMVEPTAEPTTKSTEEGN